MAELFSEEYETSHC